MSSQERNGVAISYRYFLTMNTIAVADQIASPIGLEICYRGDSALR
jgi:hypothetical protein